jgi:Protein of unknown function (DUF3108)
MVNKRRHYAQNLLLAAIVPMVAAAFSLQTYALRSRLHSEIAAGEIVGNNSTVEAPMPFRIGEILNYDVAWSAFSSAATVQLCVTERREILGSRTWHFRAAAHTLSPLRTFMPVDDQIDSYTDASTFESRQYETYFFEMGKKDNQILHFVVPGQLRRSSAPAVLVSPGTLDPLGALYMLRHVDWQRTPEFRAPVFDGEDLVEMRAHLDVANEIVAVKAGNFSASCVSVHEYQHGEELKQESLSICFAHDAARTPVLLEAEILSGSVRIELSSTPR